VIKWEKWGEIANGIKGKRGSGKKDAEERVEKDRKLLKGREGDRLMGSKL